MTENMTIGAGFMGIMTKKNYLAHNRYTWKHSCMYRRKHEVEG